jgi:hypothetical protein
VTLVCVATTRESQPLGSRNWYLRRHRLNGRTFFLPIGQGLELTRLAVLYAFRVSLFRYSRIGRPTMSSIAGPVGIKTL